MSATPDDATSEAAVAAHDFFSYWYEWVRAPRRRRPPLRIDLPQSASSILHRLHHVGPTHITALARSFGLDKSTVSRQIEPLRSEALIDERPSAADRRVSQLSLNDKGEAIYQEIADAQIDYWRTVVARLSPRERRDLARLLRRLRQVIDENDTESTQA